MPQSFAVATAVHRVPSEAGADRTADADPAGADPPVPGARATYRADIVEGWDILGNANGGYLLAIVGRSIQDWCGRPPVTITAHYLAPGTAGPVTVNIEMIRSGRSFSTVTGELWQGERKLLQVLGTFGRPPTGGFEHVALAPPEIPAFDDPEVIPSIEMIEASPAIFSNIDTRLTAASGGFRLGQPSGTAVSEGWFAFRTEEPIDEIALLLVADAFPPPIFNIDAPAGWVPTVELTVHVRGVPAPGPVRCRFASEYIADGLVGEDGEVWDASGRMVCQSRQLALVPRGE